MLTDKLIHNQYDFQQDQISQRVAQFQIPYVIAQVGSSRVTGSGFKRSKFNNGKPTRQLLNNFQYFLNQQKIDEQRRVQNLKNRQKFISQDIKKYQENRSRKLQQLQQVQRNKLLEECTFKPKTNNNNNSQKRNFDQFLEHQKQHVQKVNAKKENIKKQIQSKKIKQTFKPSIGNNKNKNLKKNDVPVFKRLYDSRDKDFSVSYQEKFSFQPTITQKSKKMQRGLPIDELLYCDALRRQEKARESQSFIGNQSFVENKEANINSLKNEKFAAQKFIKEYFFALNSLEISQGKIDYIMYNQLLKILGFISGQESESTNATLQRALVHKSYQLLEQYQVNARNICVFLLALLGIYHINPINFDQSQNSLPPQKELNFEVQQGRKTQKEYDLLYRNRLSSEGNRKTELHNPQYSFHPAINKESQDLAERYRSKMLEQANDLLDKYPQIQFNIPQNGEITHSDLLVIYRMAKDIDNSKKKLANQDRKMEECTFKPTTLSSYQTLNQTMNNTLNNSKCEGDFGNGNNAGTKKSHELYNYHKNLQEKRKSLKASRQVQAQDKECTFKPKINKGSIKQHHAPIAKQTDQMIYRMRKGYQNHIQKKNFLERGQKVKDPQNSSVNSSISHGNSYIQNKSSYESQQTTQNHNPHLIIDVNMGDRIQQIYIYQGDQKNIPLIAQKFAMKHNLDYDSQVKLIQLLKAQIQSVLDKIDEGQQSQNDY